MYFEVFFKYNSHDFWHNKKPDSCIILKDFAERLNFKIAPHIEFQIITVIGKGQENLVRIIIRKVFKHRYVVKVIFFEEPY